MVHVVGFVHESVARVRFPSPSGHFDDPNARAHLVSWVGVRASGSGLGDGQAVSSVGSVSSGSVGSRWVPVWSTQNVKPCGLIHSDVRSGRGWTVQSLWVLRRWVNRPRGLRLVVLVWPGGPVGS